MRNRADRAVRAPLPTREAYRVPDLVPTTFPALRAPAPDPADRAGSAEGQAAQTRLGYAARRTGTTSVTKVSTLARFSSSGNPATSSETPDNSCPNASWYRPNLSITCSGDPTSTDPFSRNSSSVENGNWLCRAPGESMKASKIGRYPSTASCEVFFT